MGGWSLRKRERGSQFLRLPGLGGTVARFDDLDDVPRMLWRHRCRFAVADQARHAAGKDSIGYLNPLLYTLPPSDFMDVVPETFGTGDGLTTLDSNEQFGTGVAGMPTTAGWDLSTGWGSPNVPAFVGDLVAAP
jgi:hypothetical protein